MRTTLAALALGWCTIATAEPPIASDLQLASGQFAEAMNSGDFETVAAMTHPRIVEIMGGREMVVAAMRELRAKIPPVMDIRFDRPGPIVKMPQGAAAIVPYTATMQVDKGTLLVQSFYIGWRQSTETNWVFADGNGAYRPGALELLFPGYTNELPIPEKKKPLLVPPSEDSGLRPLPPSAELKR